MIKKIKERDKILMGVYKFQPLLQNRNLIFIRHWS